MTKTSNSGASEADASNLSDSTGNAQETPKESASGHIDTELPREEDLPNPRGGIMSKGKLAGYDTQADSCNGYDTQAISAAKDFVCDLLYEEAETDCDGSVSNGIDLAEEVIGGLLAAGALIPSDLVYDGNGLHSGREES